MAIQTGWGGRFYEDFNLGDVYIHPVGRTVTEVDNTWFTQLTCNTHQVHFNAHYAARTEFGRCLVNSAFTLSLVAGMSVADVSENGVANLGWEYIKLPAPVFAGDTLYAETVILSKRESRSRPNAGIVRFKTRGYNQDGVTVIEFVRTILVYKQDGSPRNEIAGWRRRLAESRPPETEA